ncbi:hypothetical protein D3C86_1772320 [compost metagenome]
MGGQKRGLHGDGKNFFQSADHAQHFQLTVDRKAVTAFDLYGAGSLPDHVVQSDRRRFKQLIFGSQLQFSGRV